MKGSNGQAATTLESALLSDAIGDAIGDDVEIPDIDFAESPAAESVVVTAESGSILDKRDPLTTARLFVAAKYRHRDGRTLAFNGEAFYAWDGTAYVATATAALRAELYGWLAAHQREKPLPAGGVAVEPFKPTKRDVDEVLDALKAVAHTAAAPPAWLAGVDERPDPRQLVVARNGVWDASGDVPRPLFAPTPILFTLNALDYDVAPSAPRPAAWLEFLDLLFPDDPESIDTPGEWFGYSLTADTAQQKILALVGPTRSGKGTIARVLSRMLGMSNICAPTLSGIATNFGLWSLIGKLLAIISDARLSGRTDQAVITERLLSVSGEDSLTIDRKNLVPLTLKLPTRIMVCTNELPRLSDSSGALANRFLILVLRESFLGREETGLTERLCAELPGILCWALAGRHPYHSVGGSA